VPEPKAKGGEINHMQTLWNEYFGRKILKTSILPENSSYR
jgi:hypothetical protein